MSDGRPRLRRNDPTEFADPYAAWQEAREEVPVFWDDRLGYWQINRYDDVVAAVMNTEQLSSAGFYALVKVYPENQHLIPRGFEWQAPSLANADPPDHTRIRKLASEAFKPRRVAALESGIRVITDELIDAFVLDGTCELIEQFTVPLSLLTMAKILGMPASDVGEMRRYSDEMPASLDPSLTPAQQAEILVHYGTFVDFLESRIEQRRANPGPDLLTTLIQGMDQAAEGEPTLSHMELISLVANLIVAGNETTRYLIGNMVLLLCRHPEQLAALRANPELAEATVEETLRYFTSVKGNIRLASSNIEIGGVTIPAGSLVQVNWGSAGRDKTVFERPDEFDIFRPDARKHIAFSKGAHNCIGHAVARLEAKVALEQLLARLPDFDLIREPIYPDDYVWGVQVQGVKRLLVNWRPSNVRPELDALAAADADSA